MTAIVAPIFALLLSVALLLMGNGLQGTLLPVRASIEDFSALDIGLLGSAYFLGFAIGCLSGPHIVRRAGHIRAFTAMVAIASCVVLAHAIVLQPLVWWSLRMATGLCFAVLYMIIESWLNEKSSNENRGLVFSIYTIVNLTVITLGQMMLTLDEPTNFPLFSLASILVSLAAVPVALTRSPAPTPIETVHIRFRKLLQASPVGVVGCFSVGLANGAFWALAPVFAQGESVNVADVALFMSTAVIAGAIGQWPLGRMSDRMDRRRVIVFACTGAAVAGLSLALIDSSWTLLLSVAAFGYGMFAFPLYAVSVAHTNDFVEPAGYVEAASGLLLVFALGAVAGPIIASVFVRFAGISSLFAYTACVHVATAAFALYRMQHRKTRLREEHIAFGDAIRVAQTVSAVDPLSHPGHTPGDAIDPDTPSTDTRTES
ncbi:MAG: MFS transporter [Gammaproteobacteria bacterium]|nr:MFS transporter [Gammaproteobacteria bacterium]